MNSFCQFIVDDFTLIGLDVGQNLLTRLIFVLSQTKGPARPEVWGWALSHPHQPRREIKQEGGIKTKQISSLSFSVQNYVKKGDQTLS